jgi:hypothetical protein
MGLMLLPVFSRRPHLPLRDQPGAEAKKPRRRIIQAYIRPAVVGLRRWGLPPSTTGAPTLISAPRDKSPIDAPNRGPSVCPPSERQRFVGYHPRLVAESRSEAGISHRRSAP